MKRRALLVGVTSGVLVGGGTAAWLAGSPAPVSGMRDWASVQLWLDGLARSATSTRSGWSLTKVLHHLAQSIEYSMDGYPEMKPAWFRASLGALAGRAFQRAGAMRHGLEEPIPGAPSLQEMPTPVAIFRLRAAIERYAAHEDPLHPHFAYGQLDRESYTRAHLMHIADHARLVRLPGTSPT